MRALCCTEASRELRPQVDLPAWRGGRAYMAKELGEPSEASADPGGDAEVGRFLAKQQRCDFFNQNATRFPGLLVRAASDLCIVIYFVNFQTFIAIYYNIKKNKYAEHAPPPPIPAPLL